MGNRFKNSLSTYLKPWNCSAIADSSFLCLSFTNTRSALQYEGSSSCLPLCPLSLQVKYNLHTYSWPGDCLLEDTSQHHMREAGTAVQWGNSEAEHGARVDHRRKGTQVIAPSQGLCLCYLYPKKNEKSLKRQFQGNPIRKCFAFFFLKYEHFKIVCM